MILDRIWVSVVIRICTDFGPLYQDRGWQGPTVNRFYVLKYWIRIKLKCLTVLRIRDPVPLWPLDPGLVKKSGSPGSGINNPDHISESLETVFGLKYLNSLMRIRDKHPGSATLMLDRDPLCNQCRSTIQIKINGKILYLFLISLSLLLQPISWSKFLFVCCQIQRCFQRKEHIGILQNNTK